MKKIKFVFVLFPLIISSLLLSACGPREVVLSPSDPFTIANGGQPVYVDNDPIKRCLEGGKSYYMDLVDENGEPMTISFCDPSKNMDGQPVDIIDAAMLVTMATPWPGDEEIAFVIWAGKTVVKVAVYAGSAYLATQGVLATSAYVAESAYVVETTGLYTTNVEMASWHDPNHDITVNLVAVTAMLTTYTTWVATGGPNKRDENGSFRCLVLMIGNQIARFMVWSKVTANILVWTADGAWVTFFGPKAGGALFNVPDNIRMKYGNTAHVESVSCGSLPPFPPLPQ